MRWLARILGIPSKEELSGAYLMDRVVWSVDIKRSNRHKKRTSLYKVLSELLLLFPEDATLALEGTISSEMQAFLRDHAAEHPLKVARSTVWPRSQVFHMPLTTGNLQGLMEIAERCAEPEVCDHFMVYVGREVLLSAHDACTQEAWVSLSVDEKRIARYCEAVGCSYEKEDTTGG